MVSDENPNAPTTSEILRRASALMRERAKKATPGSKWEHDTKPYGHADESSVAINYRPGVFAVGYLGTPGNAEHVASWHPAVALAVADLLDSCAQSYHPDFGSLRHEGALAVARAYLGGAA